MTTPYDKIESVLKQARRPLAPHEFASVRMEVSMSDETESRIEQINGREFVGQSESAIGRRLREMRKDGRVTSAPRAGTQFKEYSLVKKEAPATAAAA